MQNFAYDINEILKEMLKGFYSPVMGALKIILIAAAAYLCARIGRLAVRKFFERQRAKKSEKDFKRIDTLNTLLASVIKYSLYIVAAVVILTDVFHLTSVLAAAGIGGVALGFGTQSLIKDIISGFFIVFEDQFAVGDKVTIGSYSGTVEQMELRVTKLRDPNGALYIIPNGEIKTVANHTR